MVLDKAERTCVVCKDVFCCIACCERHQTSKHPLRELKCAFCKSQKLPWKQLDSQNLECHIVLNHLPLYCCLCGTVFKSSADLQNIGLCKWYATQNYHTLMSHGNQEVTGTLSPIETKSKHVLRSSGRLSIDNDFNGVSTSMSSPPELVRHTSTPMHVSVHGKKVIVEFKTPNASNFSFKTPKTSTGFMQKHSMHSNHTRETTRDSGSSSNFVSCTSNDSRFGNNNNNNTLYLSITSDHQKSNRRSNTIEELNETDYVEAIEMSKTENKNMMDSSSMNLTEIQDSLGNRKNLTDNSPQLPAPTANDINLTSSCCNFELTNQAVLTSQTSEDMNITAPTGGILNTSIEKLDVKMTERSSSTSNIMDVTNTFEPNRTRRDVSISQGPENTNTTTPTYDPSNGSFEKFDNIVKQLGSTSDGLNVTNTLRTNTTGIGISASQGADDINVTTPTGGSLNASFENFDQKMAERSTPTSSNMNTTNASRSVLISQGSEDLNVTTPTSALSNSTFEKFDEKQSTSTSNEMNLTTKTTKNAQTSRNTKDVNVTTTAGGILYGSSYEKIGRPLTCVKRVRFSDQSELSINMNETRDMNLTENEVFFEASDNMQNNSKIKRNESQEDDSSSSSVSGIDVESQDRLQNETQGLFGNEVTTKLNTSNIKIIMKQDDEVFTENIENSVKEKTVYKQRTESSRVVMMLMIQDGGTLKASDLTPLIDAGLKQLGERNLTASVETNVPCETQFSSKNSKRKSITTVDSYVKVSNVEYYPSSNSSTSSNDSTSNSDNKENTNSSGILSTVVQAVKYAIKNLSGSSDQNININDASTSEETLITGKWSSFTNSLLRRPRKRSRDIAELSKPIETNTVTKKYDGHSPLPKRQCGWPRPREPLRRMRNCITSPRGISSEKQVFKQGSLTVGDTILPIPSRAHQSTQTE